MIDNVKLRFSRIDDAVKYVCSNRYAVIGIEFTLQKWTLE